MADSNLLSKDVEIKGTLRSQSDLFLDGRLQGEIHCAGALTIGEHAEVEGEVTAKAVSVRGRVNGNISASERCELKASAHLVGDLQAPRLVIEEGATFVGKSEVSPAKSKGFTPEILPSAQKTA